MQVSSKTFRDRIVELRRVPARELIANPRNWRRHPARQAAALRGVLEEVGYADALEFPARALRMIFCEAGRRPSNSASVIRRSRLSGVTTDTAEHSTQTKLSPGRGSRLY